MLNLENLPPDVTRLAQGCLVQNLTAQQLMHQTPEECLEFAREAGFASWDSFLAAIDWVSDFFEARTKPHLN
jgi:hypothetical protein